MGVNRRGALVISLDFELFWGCADFADYKEWQDKIEEVQLVVPEILKLFQKYEIHATWATVGGILADNEKEFKHYMEFSKSSQFQELIMRLWPVDGNGCPDSMLFAPELVEMISQTENQEIGTHTYSHYYCSNGSSKPQDFYDDLEASLAIFKDKGYHKPRSVVFPRNQVGKEYVNVIPKQINVYRGVELGWVTKLKNTCPSLGILLWYLDHYMPIRKSRSYQLQECSEENRYNIRQSRFFKAYNPKYALFENIKIKRYKLEMKKAAIKGEIFHMCWHPHNFSGNLDKNIQQLTNLFEYYLFLKEKYNMTSLTMAEVADLVGTK